MYDLIVRNARIADGLGNPLVEGDLAVKDGRVAAVGHIREEAAQTVDARGKVLAPGAVDLHTHYDAQLTWDPTCSPSPALGVTTVVIGNCGFGVAPAKPEVRDTILKNLSEVEAMSLDALRAGFRWEFETFGEYLAFLKRQRPYPNVATFASHTVMRTNVMGDAGSDRPATADEQRQIVQLFREAMQSGAVGLGSSTNENHRGFGGIPIASRMATDDEFRALMKVMAEFDHGLFMITCGEQTGPAFLEELSNISGRPSVYAPLMYYGNQPERARSLMQACRAARARGAPVYAQTSCQPLSLSFMLDAAYILKTVTPWPTSGDRTQLRAIFSDRSFRDAWRESLSRFDSARIFNGNWKQMDVTTVALEKNRAMEGRSIAELAAERGVDPVDLFLDLGLEEDFATIYTGRILNDDDERVGELLVDDGVLVSLSDAGAHNTFLCDAGYAMYFYGHWVRDVGLFDLPAAIRKVTSDPADLYGLIDRGRLTVGAWADMILFDPETITITGLERHNDLPAGGGRLLRRAPGLAGTWVNGVQVFDGERYLDIAGPGEVITRFASGLPALAMPEARRGAAE